jgi:DNA segregation ATPase FtsK/SpoIIIE, S-DNA-T family
MAGTRIRSSRRRPARRSRSGRRGRWRPPRWPLRLPQLDERQRDVLALALIAVGIFMGVVIYGASDGGRVGHALAVALGWGVGRAKALAPLALVAAGGAMLMRPVLSAMRPLRTGGVCLFAAILLALAAGTLGVTGGQETGASHWSSHYLQAHGGALGQALYEATHRLVQQAGVDILVVFLFLVGAILLTGASLAAGLRATGGGLLDSTRVLRTRLDVHRSRPVAERMSPESPGSPHALDGSQETLASGRSRETLVSGEDPRFGQLVPPEPEPEALVVRATHVEAPSLDGGGSRGQEGRRADDERYAGDSGEEPSERLALEPEHGSLSAAVARARDGISALHADPDDPASQRPTDRDLTPQGRLREHVTGDPEFEWRLPNPDRVLTRSSAKQARAGGDELAGQERTAGSLVEALGHHGVQAKVIGTVAGPHITRYELRLAPGTKVAKVAQLKDDLAYALAATDIRILAPIPGKQAVGVEVPNARRRIVRLGDVFQEPPPDWSPLTVWLGKDVAGKAIGADLAKMPHLLVAGTTGAGKSGAVNAMLASVLLRASPHELRLVLVDPKQVELNHYESIPHLLTPVITSPRMAANALQNLVKEMEQRYGTMSLARTRSLPELNRSRRDRGEAPLPYILCVIDELADLMMVAPADVEDSIIHLAQKARAVGIHLVLATQSPRVDVITGMIKANVPSRIAFAVSSQTDSRVILDQNGAESLLGQGDMLFSPVGSSRLQRIQGAYIDEPQIAKLTDYWRRQGEPQLREELLEEVEPSEPEETSEDFDPDEDPLLKDAIALVAEMQTASTSMLQRRLRLGYTRAGRLIDMLERRGVISGYEGSKPRQVLITEADVPRVVAGLESHPPARAVN